MDRIKTRESNQLVFISPVNPVYDFMLLLAIRKWAKLHMLIVTSGFHRADRANLSQNSIGSLALANILIQ